MSDSSQPMQDPGHPILRARHPVSIVHLVMGVALLGLGVSWALVAGDRVAVEDISVLLPLPWIVAGAAGLAALIASDRRTLTAQRKAESPAKESIDALP